MQIIMKHTGSPIPDLFVDAEIDVDKRLVTIRLKDHLDSALLIQFCRNVLEPEGVRVVDNVSHQAFGPGHGEGRHELEIHVFGQVLDAQIVQLISVDKSPSDTLSLRPKTARKRYTVEELIAQCEDSDESAPTLEEKLERFDPDKHSGEAFG